MRAVFSILQYIVCNVPQAGAGKNVEIRGQYSMDVYATAMNSGQAAGKSMAPIRLLVDESW